MLSCAMPHASDWLLAPPIPGLGLSLQSDDFRTALKFRLSMPLYDKPFSCPAVSSGSGAVCDAQMDVFGDHAMCCLFSPSLVFRHNNIRDILGHSARAAGLDREEEPDRRLERQIWRHHSAAVPSWLCIFHF